MDVKTRAEKIPLYVMYDIPGRKEETYAAIAAQIEEAVEEVKLEILGYSYRKLNLADLRKEFPDLIAEAEREAVLKVQHTCCEWNKENEDKAWQEGFNTAREKAAGIAEAFDNQTRYEDHPMSQLARTIAERIRAMEAEK